MADFERVIFVKNEIFVYQIPARSSNRGYRAADWNLDNPAWSGRLRVVSTGKDLNLKLEDKNSGELFATCPVDKYPGVAVEQVLDSSRYFVIRIQDPSNRHAFIGIGFADRADSFDLLVSITDHFKWLKRDEDEAAEVAAPQDSGPKLDLSFKEGQTIKINIGNKSGEAKKSRPRGNNGGGALLPPPPPGSGIKLPAPPRGPSAVTPPGGDSSFEPTTSAVGDFDFLSGLSAPPTSSLPQPLAQPVAAQQQNAPSAADPWGDFASAGSTPGNPSSTQSQGGGWVQF